MQSWPKLMPIWGSDSMCLGEVWQYHKSFAASVQHCICQFSQYKDNLHVEYEFPPWTYNCNSLTSRSLLYSPSCVITSWTSRLGNLSLCQFIQLQDVPFCQDVVSHWAGPMFWSMVKNVITNTTYDARAAGFLNSATYIQSPWRSMCRMISSNFTLCPYINRWLPSIK
jgi:hypothetical protein